MFSFHAHWFYTPTGFHTYTSSWSLLCEVPTQLHARPFYVSEWPFCVSGRPSCVSERPFLNVDTPTGLTRPQILHAGCTCPRVFLRLRFPEAMPHTHKLTFLFLNVDALSRFTRPLVLHTGLRHVPPRAVYSWDLGDSNSGTQGDFTRFRGFRSKGFRLFTRFRWIQGDSGESRDSRRTDPVGSGD